MLAICSSGKNMTAVKDKATISKPHATRGRGGGGSQTRAAKAAKKL